MLEKDQARAGDSPGCSAGAGPGSATGAYAEPLPGRPHWPVPGGPAFPEGHRHRAGDPEPGGQAEAEPRSIDRRGAGGRALPTYTAVPPPPHPRASLHPLRGICERNHAVSYPADEDKMRRAVARVSRR